jgi:cytochrome c-type biogenesis protein CcmH
MRAGSRLGLVAAFALVALAGAPVQGRGTPSTDRVAADAKLEEQVRAIAAELRCPVCQNLSVADSPSDLAREIRSVIRAQLEAGKSSEEVKAYFLSRYGDWILLAPRPRGLNVVVWVGPFAGAVVGLALVGLALRRWTRRVRPVPRRAAPAALVERACREALVDEVDLGAPGPEGLSPLARERNRLYAALRELDFDRRCGKLSDTDYAAVRDDYEWQAAEILGRLDRERPGPPTAMPADAGRGAHPSPAADGTSEVAPRRPRRWRVAAGVAVAVGFGLALGYFLNQSLRLRMGEQDTITGDFLTGTGPGGIMPDGRAPEASAARLLASGRAAYERLDWKAAIDAFRQTLAIEGDNAEAHAFLAMILLQAGHVDDALLAVDRALTKDPRDPFGLWVKGIVLFEGKQDYARAIGVWEQLMLQPLPEGDADQVAQALTEARRRLIAPAARPLEPRDRREPPGSVTGGAEARR